jgi:DNA-binding GntR family transcriptional regulator
MQQSVRSQPSYRSLVAALLDAIRDGDLGPNGQLPTETELVDRYRVSRGTVRRAYLELVSDGVVQRFPGKGTFVTRPEPYRRLFGSIDELLALSVDTVMEVLSPLSNVADIDAASALGLQFDEVIRIGYRRLHADAPFCYTEVYLPPRLISHLSGAKFLYQVRSQSKETVLGILDRALPQPIAGARQTVTAVALPEPIAATIDCPVGAPAMQIERVHFDAEGRAVERCLNYFNPSRYAYRSQLQRRSMYASATSGDGQ